MCYHIGKKIILFLALNFISVLVFSQISTISADTSDAFAAFKNKDYPKAVTIFSNLIGAGTNNFELYFNRGVSYSKLHQYHEAIKDYNKVLVIKPNHFDASINKGIANYRLSKAIMGQDLG